MRVAKKRVRVARKFSRPKPRELNTEAQRVDSADGVLREDAVLLHFEVSRRLTRFS